MRVCLINPPRIQPKAWGKPNVFPPIVMASVAAVLENKKHAVSIIDAPTEGWANLLSLDESKYRVGLSAETIEARLTEWKPDVVAVEIPFSGWSKTAYEVVSIAKKVNKNIVVVLFGLHPSSRPEDCLENADTDFVVVGEPEYTVAELVEALEQKKRGFRSIDGLGFKEKGKVVLTNKRAVIEDLDVLPLPARHLLPMEVYAQAVKANPLRGEITKPYTIVITSRGCPFNCVFCTHCIVWGKQWRPRSPKNVVDELEHVIKTYRIMQVDFADDNMTWDRQRMAEICDLIVARGLRFEWFTPNGVRADTLDEALLRKMKRAGCKKIRVAPESGVQRVVTEIAQKSLDLKKVEAAVVACKKVGIKVGCFFVLGLIGETKADIEETIRYAYKLKRLGAESFIFSIAMPLYGTAFYEQAKASGYIKEGFCDYALAATEPLVETPEWSAVEISELCMKANAINRTLTRKKVLKAMRHPYKTAKMLLRK
ncbi:MAG: B12-binding domain-containing radical SAM protein [Candidatus Bathyarchaeota archaeon]|nr:B12-binding domain-containing radical SAM protein [Chloroflexota bacterium]MCL5877869.1 B12-binding domain-containing radical SAM protein [Candidatus Bathyarchaeota archaeon]